MNLLEPSRNFSGDLFITCVVVVVIFALLAVLNAWMVKPSSANEGFAQTQELDSALQDYNGTKGACQECLAHCSYLGSNECWSLCSETCTVLTSSSGATLITE